MSCRLVTWLAGRQPKLSPTNLYLREPRSCLTCPSGIWFVWSWLLTCPSAWLILSVTSTPHRAAEFAGRPLYWPCAQFVRLGQQTSLRSLPSFFTLCQLSCGKRRMYSHGQEACTPLD